MPPIFIAGMWGLGDNIFQRSLIRRIVAAREVYLDTPWPELYRDLGPVKFHMTKRNLRTQLKNVMRQPPGTYLPALPAGIARLNSQNYGSWLQSSILAGMEGQLRLPRAPSIVFDLPHFQAPAILTDRPIAIVRPVTVRAEWRNEARNPLPVYVERVAARLMETHFVVSVADLEDGREWLEGAAPPCHLAAHSGEFAVDELLGLVRVASIVVGGVGWIVPAAIAARVPAFIILGGQGAHNAPARVTDKRLDLSRIGFAYPERFCMCADMRHRCLKTIADIDAQFDAFLDRLGGLDAIALQRPSAESVGLAS